MVKKVTIFGERCSGTKYLQKLLEINFHVEITWEYGAKHFFGFKPLSDDVLYIGIVRNLTDWVNSLWRIPYHVPKENTKDVHSFLTNEWWSEYEGREIMEDRNLETGNRYKNILEMRHVKNKFLVETMPKIAKQYCLITYDELMNNFMKVMNKIKGCGLEVKNPICLNIKNPNEKRVNVIPREVIEKKANLYYENMLFPKKLNMVIKT